MLKDVSEERITFNVSVEKQPHKALGFTQPLTEMSTRSRKIMFLGCRAWPERRADNIVAICEPIV
jgi:hypothetical protein